MSIIDQYSVATVPVQMLFGTTKLAQGTGFIWLNGSAHYLITNWHNVSGKDPRSRKHLSETLAEPDCIQIWWNVKGKLGERFTDTIPIRSTEGDPLWWVHPEYGSRVDVIALPLPSVPGADMHPINHMPTAKGMRATIGQEVFVIGYPFGINAGGLPIWKRGSLASEPDMIDDADPFILVDTASRPGMSGSPVIRRQWGSYTDEKGNIFHNGEDATRLMGVYSGRLSTNDPHDAQLGLVWPVTLLEEIISGKSLDA
jgi:hypothetical protein